MSLLCNVLVCVHLVLMMTVMLAFSIHRIDRENPSDKLFAVILITITLMLIIDPLSRFDGTVHPAFPVINRIANFLLFVMSPMTPSLWLLYVLSWLRKEAGEIRKAIRWMVAFNAMNIVMVVASLFAGWYYSIGPGNIYVRGPYYLVSVVFMLAPLVAAYIVTLINRKHLELRVFIGMLVFPAPPLIGTLMQVFFYGYPFALTSLVISSLILLLFVQDRSIYKDYLTGTGNRRQLYSAVTERINRSSPGRTFSLVMLDIDNFKAVNDEYGHEAGDKVLIATAKMLVASVRAKDYVTRYGGDEFVLVVDISNRKDLEALLDRIEANRKKLNESEELPIELSFSVGSIVFRYGTPTNAAELIRQVDGEMYSAKKSRRNGLA